jgi:Response regulator containing CheY-like receiver domain and AraC-type DNA-binding domain
MLKVLIVDDNAYSRTELKTMIDWESCGFLISGEASNGMNAIQLMERDMPDIVITDINMPVLNGVDFIDYVEKNCPHVQVIALSAYDDFEYVRQSMKKGAIDYVLKHRLNASVLTEILNAAATNIFRERDQHQWLTGIAEELSMRKAAMRQEFLRKLLTGSLTDRAEAIEQFESLEIRLDSENLVVTIAEIDDFPFVEEKYTPREVDVLIRTFLNISEEIIQEWEKSIIIHMSQGRFAIIFSLSQTYSKLYVYNKLYDILNRIRSQIKKFLNITASFGSSKICRDILLLHQAYLEAENSLRNKFFKGKNGIFIENTDDKSEQVMFSLDIRAEKEIYAALRNLDEEGVIKRIDEVFEMIKSSRLERKSTQMICAELVHIVSKVCKDMGIEMASLYSSRDIPYTMIQKYETLMDMKEWVLGLYLKLMNLQKRMKFDNSLSKVTRKAVEFIHQNFDKNISLTEAADYVGVSASYISRLFKEECGVGFAEYLNQVRVERAKLLIENGEMKLKDIVSRVGFNNYNYFFRVFKELVGMTPLEYEQRAKSYSGV